MVVAIGNWPARPSAIVCGMSLSERMIASRKTTPTAPEMSTDDRTPRGAWRLASMVSSPNVPAVSNPYRMKIDMKKASANVASMLPFWACLRTERLGQDVGRLVVREEQQDEREDEHPEDLGRHADVVERSRRSRTPNALMSVVITSVVMAMNVNMSLHAERRRAGQEVLLAHDPVDHEGDDAGDRGHRHDLRPEVEPAGEPAERPMREALRPLVDRAGDRVVARQLGEAERDEELAGDDDQPRPEHRRPAEAEADAEVAERPGRDADEAEREREVREEPERPVQLRV